MLASEEFAQSVDTVNIPLDLPLPSDGAVSLFFLFLLGRVPAVGDAGTSSLTSMKGRTSPVLFSRVRFEEELNGDESGTNSGDEIVDVGERGRIGDPGTLGRGDKEC